MITKKIAKLFIIKIIFLLGIVCILTSIQLPFFQYHPGYYNNILEISIKFINFSAIFGIVYIIFFLYPYWMGIFILIYETRYLLFKNIIKSNDDKYLSIYNLLIKGYFVTSIIGFIYIYTTIYFMKIKELYELILAVIILSLVLISSKQIYNKIKLRKKIYDKIIYLELHYVIINLCTVLCLISILNFTNIGAGIVVYAIGILILVFTIKYKVYEVNQKIPDF